MNNLENFNARELTSKHAWLMDEIKKLPSGTEIAPEKTAEIKELEAVLRQRLYRLMIGDVLPVLATAAKIITQRPGIFFHFEVFSILNTRIDRFKIEAATKVEAWKEAREKAKQYPGHVNLKIS